MTVINDSSKYPSNIKYGNFCPPQRSVRSESDASFTSLDQQLSRLLMERLSPLINQPSPTEVRLTNLLANVIQQFVSFAEMTLSLFANVAGSFLNSQAQTPPSQTPGTPSSPQTPSPGSGTPTTVGNSGQFLWKPQSDKDGKLAILLPPNMSDGVKAVTILDPVSKKVLARGKDSGTGNGGRAHFRFNKAGGEYPDNAVVVILYNNGEQKRVSIPDTASRYTR